MEVYLKEDEFNESLILKNAVRDTFYIMDWEGDQISFVVYNRVDGDTDEDILDNFECQRDKSIRKFYKTHEIAL